MKRKIAELWAQALLSGDYKQGKDRLRKGDKFCCLGVLCNLHAQAHPKIAADEKDKGTYLNAETDLPVEVQKWAGCKYTNGSTMKPIIEIQSGLYSSLAEANDKGVEFERIAGFILGNSEKL